MKRINRYITIFFLLIFLTQNVFSQIQNNSVIKNYIEKFKKDQRGPYKEIRWFCKDGSTLPPNERCSEPGGVQRASYKEQVQHLAKTNKVYLGQILAATDNDDFWDEKNGNMRFKQYKVEKYLRAVDNGWILRRAQFYRGAFQAENEENWGMEFFTQLLAKDDLISNQYFLIRESFKDIPHQSDKVKTQNIRAVSKNISEEYSPFMSLRIKIHGQPDFTDLEKVKEFKEKNKLKLTSELLQKFDELIADLETVYKPVDFNSINKHLKNISKNTGLKDTILTFIKNSQNNLVEEKIREAADLIWHIRKNLLNEKNPKGRIALLDISLKLENIIFREIDTWQTINIKDHLLKNYVLCKAIAATGLIEIWEWEQLQKKLLPPKLNKISLGDLNSYLDNSRRIVEWSLGMVRSNYEEAINLFLGFEPLTSGFFDDLIRSSLLLPQGNLIEKLNEFVSARASLSNNIIDFEIKGSIRGLNSGYAMGELIVLESLREIEFSQDKIYVLERSPADLKPVAGIATVTEGNIISHIQLLARNLGIPNAVISPSIFNELKKHSGRKVFYAVSKSGTVIIKLTENMTAAEKKLFEKKIRKDERINIPVNKLELEKSEIVDLKNIRAKNSGRLCGPKAANLGELKFLFPNNVVNGFVIPFGIFKTHLDQIIPGTNETYWQFLDYIFTEAEKMQKTNIKKEDIETFTLQKLGELGTAIKNINLLPGFVNNLEESFQTILNKPIGDIAVFIRSDTNMEDLKDFTGAGLNLTLFNVIDKEKILQGIRDVWASPYSERSYKWRQKFLLNPENVYPSLLIIPTVNVDKSGVMITKGITTANDNDITAAFSKGAGGAVEGQQSETYLLADNNENILLFPSREIKYNILPETGGVIKGISSFQTPILEEENLRMLRQLAEEIKNKPGTNKSIGPMDIELGFLDGKIWLFQIRPFVENKMALKSEYLDSISSEFPLDKIIDLNQKL
ncbi:MAG: hypothetical protein JEY94_04275 [Melioribacteraceae bacterium]|nr:hypothetical protein [Melioribacteraceae bacterium]